MRSAQVEPLTAKANPSTQPPHYLTPPPPLEQNPSVSPQEPRPKETVWARLFRGPRSYPMIVAAAAAVTGLVVAAVAGLASGGDSLGKHTAVVVATQAITPGEPIDASNTEVRKYPALTLPEGSVSALGGGEVASAGIFPGDVVTTARLGGLQIGNRTEVAIPAQTALPSLEPGDLVDVLVTLEVANGLGNPNQATLVVATDALVTHTADTAVTIAVTSQELLPVASAVIHGSITLALVERR